MAALALAGAEAQATTVTMTGVVHTVCEASFTMEPVAIDARRYDLGQLKRSCNDGAGYRIVIHTPAGLSGAVLVLGTKQIALSDNGTTVVVDSDTDGRAVEPARIVLTAPAAQPLTVRLETIAKGPIY